MRHHVMQVQILDVPGIRRLLRESAHLLIAIDEADPVLVADEITEQANELRVAFRKLGLKIEGQR